METHIYNLWPQTAMEAPPHLTDDLKKSLTFVSLHQLICQCESVPYGVLLRSNTFVAEDSTSVLFEELERKNQPFWCQSGGHVPVRSLTM